MIALSIAPKERCVIGIGRYLSPGFITDLPVDLSPHDPCPLLAIVGPTGSGKSHLALSLAHALGGEIVNYDSVQLYRELYVGSAKLNQAERLGIPHHLLDIANLDEHKTAGDYSRLARPLLEELSRRGVLPVLVGGTGFYLRALLDGLSPAPAGDPALRSRLLQLAGKYPKSLHRYLSWRDPAAARRIHPHDRQKAIRAIELSILSGKPASEMQAQPRDALLGFRIFKIGLSPDRAALYARLNERCALMFQNGLLDETERALRAGIPAGAKALQSLGYRQAVRHLRGEISLEQAIQDCQNRTRQYAKRQLTWFRADPAVQWLCGFGTESQIRAAALHEFEKFARIKKNPNQLKETFQRQKDV